MKQSQHGAALREQLRAATVLHQSGELDRAGEAYERILRAHPRNADALHMLGLVNLQQGRLAKGIALIEGSLQANAGQPMALANLGRAWLDAGDAGKAIDCLGAALKLAPQFIDLLLFRAGVLAGAGRHADALADYDAALALQPRNAAALNNRACMLLELQRAAEALQSVEQALAIEPRFAEACNNRGNALRMLRRAAESVASFEQALAIRPDYPDALGNLCGALARLRRHQDSLPLYRRLLEIRPGHPYAMGNRFHAELQCCEWSSYNERIAGIEAAVLAGQLADHPGSFLSVSAVPATQLRCATAHMRHKHPQRMDVARHAPAKRDRIRVAYLSADFGEHPVARLAAGFLARHDASRFETIGVSLAPRHADDALHQQLRSSFHQFIDVSAMDDREAAAQLAALQIDIAVDLNGHTVGARPGILTRRPAAVQVSFLGYAGTMGAPSHDYLIADAVTVPHGEAGYSEHILRLPGSCMPRDDRDRVPAPGTRGEAGLPDAGFVFCAFNTSFKLNPVMFDIWMRLLLQVPGSVLWLRKPGELAALNLRREARARGVDPDRLVFAARVDAHAAHLARHRLADLFLDTLPYNAHTTASDALFVGLPVLTCRGTAFAGRVAASLLQALQLPELIAADLQGYEALALQLARQPQQLRALRERLDINRRNLALFDTAYYTGRLEAAYEAMHALASMGQPPRDIDIPAADMPAA